MSLYDFSPPSPDLVEDWIEQAKPEPWKRPPDPNILAALAAEWGYQQCLGQFELAAMQIVPPGDDFEPDDDD